MDLSRIDLRVIGEAFNSLLESAGLAPGVIHFIDWLLGALILLLFGLNLVIGLIWLERKIAARIQDRLGPNRVGPYGLLQTIADALKLLTKEDITPRDADRVTYNLAPALAVFQVIMAIAVIPFADGVIGSDLNIGVVYIMAVAAIGSMAALMAGWASNNKYALVGGFRVVAQLLSYEIPLVFAMLIPVMVAGTMRMNGLAEAQGRFFGLGWYIWVMPTAFLIFFTAALAEGERAPFDLLEAESEIVAGFNIEYSGMKFAWFFLAFFLNSWVLAAIGTTVFLGGWQGPFVDKIPALGVIYFFAKTMVLFFVQAWVRATFPRLRIDQMMSFCWKFLVPLALVLFMVTAIVLKLGLPAVVQGLLLLVLNVVLLVYSVRLLGRMLRRAAFAPKRAFAPEIPRL
ncbi:MAG: NADH-quinone oxidoreductase subunit NuoH [Chloroflexi bacterium]|nr:MAG: NADH-quinone oxidoreductase subunit NuoH [Chloroflexota bacterium]